MCTVKYETYAKRYSVTDSYYSFPSQLQSRYGWVPNQDDIPSDIADTYNWVPNLSITHMEILHGAFRSKNPNAAFFIRKADGYLQDIPEDKLGGYADKPDIAKIQLKVWWSKVT